MSEKKISYRRYLRNWNYVVATVHTSSFIALSIISFIRLADPLFTRFVDVWTTGVTAPITLIGSYPIFATLIPFPFITAIFHVMAACGVGDYYRDVMRRARNTLRWIEYAITNGLMSWSLVFIGGDGGNLWIAISCVVSNVIMQLFGYLYEHSNEDPKRRNLWLIAVGFLPWIYNWTWVFVLYGNRASTALLSDGFGIIGSFVWSLAFVAPLVYRKYTRNKSSLRANYYTELAYILLSLSAKLWLDWAITVGNLVGN